MCVPTCAYSPTQNLGIPIPHLPWLTYPLLRGQSQVHCTWSGLYTYMYIQCMIKCIPANACQHHHDTGWGVLANRAHCNQYLLHSTLQERRTKKGKTSTTHNSLRKICLSFHSLGLSALFRYPDRCGLNSIRDASAWYQI